MRFLTQWRRSSKEERSIYIWIEVGFRSLSDLLKLARDTLLASPLLWSCSSGQRVQHQKINLRRRICNTTGQRRILKVLFRLSRDTIASLVIDRDVVSNLCILCSLVIEAALSVWIMQQPKGQTPSHACLPWRYYLPCINAY